MLKESQKINFKSRKNKLNNQPIVLFTTICILFISASFRLFWLQVLKGDYYKKLSDENRIRLVSIPPIRGRILDREFKTLVGNRISYSLTVQPRFLSIKAWNRLSIQLSNLLNISHDKINKIYFKGLEDNLLKITLIRDLSNQKVIKFREKEEMFKGFEIDNEYVRSYPYGSLGVHAFGYTQLITKKEYKKLVKNGYQINDRIGRTGIEAAYENYLRGEWGGEMLEVDSMGNVQRSLGTNLPKQGQDLVLTLDLRLQLAAERALEDKSAGAIIAIDPRTGSILAMASKPNYDPEFFLKEKVTQAEYDSIFLSKTLPLLSRVLNPYDPGSTWKIVTGMAGLESGKFPPGSELFTAPCIQYGSHCFPEHNKKGFGVIGYEDAYRLSSNTFFYQVGVGSGPSALYDAAFKLGFDQFTGIELKPEESPGLVGNEKWASEGRGWANPGETPWQIEDMASASIGQSVVQVTPLQIARAYAVFANGGYLITPHLVTKNIDWSSNTYRKKVEMKNSTYDTIRNGLRQAVVRGTGMRITYNLSDIPNIAGKTGTAEDSSGGPDHAWFVCFAPYEKSEIVIVAFAQNTPGGGSVHALPMARQVLETWNLIR